MNDIGKEKSIGLGILSWKSHETIRKSLDSYPKDFLDSFDQRIIYFSDISDKDIKLAHEYGFDYAGGPNLGIAAGMKHLAESMTTNYVLLLQNDNPLCIPTDEAITQIRKAVQLIEDGHADLARMRHRWLVGEGFVCVNKYLKYHDAQDISPHFIPSEHYNPDTRHHPIKKFFARIIKQHNAKRFQGRGIYIEDKPENVFPLDIKKHDDFLIIDSAILDFTDQCLLISRDLWLNVFVPFVEKNPSSRKPNGFQAPEICINRKWWRKNHFKILQGDGVFTHQRFDGSFRPNHHTNV